MKIKMNLDSDCKWWSIIILGLLVGLLQNPALAQQKATLETRIAVVNGVELGRLDFENQVKSHINRYASQGRTLNDMEKVILKKRVLKNMIDRQLLLGESQKAGIEAAPDEVDLKLVDLKKRFKDEAAFERAMQGLQMTPVDINKKLSQDVAVEAYINQKVAPGLAVTDAEIQAYFERIKPKIKEELLREKRRKVLEAWLAEARKTASIEDFLDTPLAPVPAPLITPKATQ